MGAILWALIGGTIIGLLAKAVAPGDHKDVPLWLTILTGIGGVLIGNFLYGQFFTANTPRVDWWRHGWQIVTAVALVSMATSLTGRKRA